MKILMNKGMAVEAQRCRGIGIIDFQENVVVFEKTLCDWSKQHGV